MELQDRRRAIGGAGRQESFRAGTGAGRDRPHDRALMALIGVGSTLLEKIMKTIGRIATASAVAFSAFAFTATLGSADPPAIIPHGHRCLSYFQGGTDCSFTSYGECEATASGQNAECYGNTPADDEDPWGTRRARQERPF